MWNTRRMIDANSNRASEAARTLEDISRFTLNDGPLALRWKRIRHELETTLGSAGLPRTVRAESRDTPGDEGVANSACDSHTRNDLHAVAAAAGSRATEALRVLEETLKLTAPDAAAAVERLRYESYDAEKLILSRLGRAPVQWPVCVLITEAICTQHSWLEIARAAIEGGAACIQLREKSLPDRELLARAHALVEMARPRDVAVVINDRADIAVLSRADGVHLGQDDISPQQARTIVGDRISVGVSCSTLAEAIDAVHAGADVLGLGAMYRSSTKTKPEISGRALLELVLRDSVASGSPHLAIGGITAERAAHLATLGCTGVAVSSAICSATDPGAATASIVRAMIATRTPQGIGT